MITAVKVLWIRSLIIGRNAHDRARLEMAQSEISVLGAEHFYREELKGFAIALIRTQLCRTLPIIISIKALLAAMKTPYRKLRN